MKKILIRVVLILGSIVIGMPLLFIALLQLTDYAPPLVQTIYQNTDPTETLQSDTLQLISWNIGYAGLGDDMDFFYDGGTQVRTTPNRTTQNLDLISQWLRSNNADFILLQEVDFNSKRSYYINQKIKFKNVYTTKHHIDFIYNYNICYIPFPITNPLGKIESGLLNISNIKPIESKRHSYDISYSWPKKLWMLDRGFMAQKFNTKTGEELCIINTHNTAFDQGEIRKREVQQLLQYAISLYENGTFVVIAGDFNQVPAKELLNQGISNEFYVVTQIDTTFIPLGWNISYDKNTPTNRSLNTSDSTLWETAIIDFVISSPNIVPLKVETSDLQFQTSDHNPVKFYFTLIK